MAPPGPSGTPGYGGAAGGGGGATGAPPMGKYGSVRVVSGNDQGKVIELNRPVTTIGRGADQMLVIADIAVSRRHLQIHMTQTGYRLQDMGSPNGTMVNGKRVSEVQLMDGDQIEVGNSLLRFEHTPSRAQSEGPPQLAASPAMNYPPPGYGAPPTAQPPLQPMGYPQSGAGYPQPGGYPPPMAMPPAFAPPPAGGQPVSPPMMAQAPLPIQPPSLLADSNPVAVAPVGAAGPLGGLSNPQKRYLYFGAIGGALLVGFVGLAVTLVRGVNPQKAIDKATELYLHGTKEFTAHRYDVARRAFESALALAPESSELKHYIESCDTEERAYKLIESAKRELESHKYGEALKLLGKVDKLSVQYEDAQKQSRMTKREAVRDLVEQATQLAKNDVPGALEKVNKGLEELDPDNAELAELKTKLSNAPAPKPQEEVAVAENSPPPEKAKAEEPKKEKDKLKPEPKKELKPEPKKEPKKEVKKETPPPKPPEPPAAAGGDLQSNKQALAAYKNRDFAGAINAMKAVKNPKAQATVKDLEDIKNRTEQAAKLEVPNPAGALSGYQAAAAIDKRLGGALASFYSGKISALQSKTAGKPAAGGEAAKDAQAEQLLAQAKALSSRNPTQARNLCRKVMQLYGNSPKNPKVQEAYRLLNSIKGGRDDDDDF